MPAIELTNPAALPADWRDILALTKPRVGGDEPKARGWRRQHAATGGPGAAYLRWPHPQG